MALTRDEVRALVEGIAVTREDEIDCEQCFAEIAAFADAELAGRSRGEASRVVREHLEDCPECAEEYEAFLVALEATRDGDERR